MNKSDKYQRWDYYGERPVLTYHRGEWGAYWKGNSAPFTRKSRVVIYHRASGPNDPYRSEQLAACREYCERNGFRVQDEYQDTRPEPIDIDAVLESQGVEALMALMRERRQRPAWDKAIEAIKEGRPTSWWCSRQTKCSRRMRSVPSPTSSATYHLLRSSSRGRMWRSSNRAVM
jgi:hypothetical protein